MELSGIFNCPLITDCWQPADGLQQHIIILQLARFCSRLKLIYSTGYWALQLMFVHGFVISIWKHGTPIPIFARRVTAVFRGARHTLDVVTPHYICENSKHEDFLL